MKARIDMRNLVAEKYDVYPLDFSLVCREKTTVLYVQEKEVAVIKNEHLDLFWTLFRDVDIRGTFLRPKKKALEAEQSGRGQG